MKILHVSDPHIKDKDAEEIDRCLQAIVVAALRERPDLAVIAGDVFDSREVKVDSGAAIMAIGFVSALAGICPVAIVLGTPAHDGAAPRILRYVRGEYDIQVADHPQQVYLEDGGLFDRPAGDREPQAVITLIPQPTKQYFRTASGIEGADKEIGAAMSGLLAGFGVQAANYPGPHILVYHGGISGAKLSTGQTLTGQDIEVSTDQLNLAGADLNLCGHIHMSQQIGDRTFYAGSPWRTNWGETEPKGFWIHEKYPHQVRDEWLSRFIETPCRKAVRIQDDLTLKSATSNIYHADVSGAHIRYDVSIFQDEIADVDKAMLTKELLERGALSVDIRIISVPRENVRAAAVLEADRLRDKLSRRAELVGETVDSAVLEMADLLEESKAEELLKQVISAGGAA